MKSLTEVKVSDIHSSFIYLFGHGFVEGYQISQARPPLAKSTLATGVLHVLCFCKMNPSCGYLHLAPINLPKAL